MIRKIILFLTLSGTLFLAGCKKDEDPKPVLQGTVYFVFENVIDGQPVQPGGLNYTNDAGNVYSVDLLKYYISNLLFLKDNNDVFAAPNYELIDEGQSGPHIFAVTLPQGRYVKLRFFMGVDSLRNVSGAQSGALDPVNGMFWDWNTGYVYFKHEGEFLDSHGDLQPLTYHYGAIEALVTKQSDIDLTVGDAPRIIKITFNLNALYRSPNVVDFNGNNIHSGDPIWVQTLRANFPGAFEVTVVQ